MRVHGIEPWTSVLSGQRSTTELYTQADYEYSKKGLILQRSYFACSATTVTILVIIGSKKSITGVISVKIAAT